MYEPLSLPVRAISTVFQVLGLTCTAWRIYFRLNIHRFWWEDAWAGVAMLSCLTSLVGEWIYLLTHDLLSNIGYWLYALGSTCAIRAAHLSIVFSVIRITREPRLRRFTYLFAACCGVCWTVILIEKIWQCASDPSWHHDVPPVCDVKPPIAIFAFTTDCVTVAILIALPLSSLWRVKLPRHQRRMILCIFASSITLAFVAIVYLIGYVQSNSILIVAGVDFEIACSIIVCNLLVVVTYVYRSLRRGDASSVAKTTPGLDLDSDDFTQPIGLSARPPMTLTTVEIYSSVPMTQHYTAHLRY